MPRVTIEFEVHAETDKALLLSTDGDESGAEWVPKSQLRPEPDYLDLSYDVEVGDMLKLSLPESIATEKGFI